MLGELRRDRRRFRAIGGCLARPDPRVPRRRTRRQDLILNGLAVQRMDEPRPQRQRPVGPLLRLSQHQQVALAGEGFTTTLHDVRRQLQCSGHLGQREVLTDDAGGLQHLPLIVAHLRQLLADEFPQAVGKSVARSAAVVASCHWSPLRARMPCATA